MRITWDDENKCVYVTRTTHIEEAINKFKALTCGELGPHVMAHVGCTQIVQVWNKF
jgi:hypothetical protein